MSEVSLHTARQASREVTSYRPKSERPVRLVCGTREARKLLQGRKFQGQNLGPPREGATGVSRENYTHCP